MSDPGCRPSMFSGMTPEQLQALLARAQTAYADLMMGSKGESFTYTQGDGTKSVTYTRANIANLTFLVSQLKQALGMPGSRRAPIRPVYR